MITIPACCFSFICIMFVASRWLIEIFSLNAILFGCDNDYEYNTASYLPVRYGSETKTKISANENDSASPPSCSFDGDMSGLCHWGHMLVPTAPADLATALDAICRVNAEQDADHHDPASGTNLFFSSCRSRDVKENCPLQVVKWQTTIPDALLLPSHKEWNRQQHALHGNTLTSTAPKAKAKSATKTITTTTTTTDEAPEVTPAPKPKPPPPAPKGPGRPKSKPKEAAKPKPEAPKPKPEAPKPKPKQSTTAKPKPPISTADDAEKDRILEFQQLASDNNLTFPILDYPGAQPEDIDKLVQDFYFDLVTQYIELGQERITVIQSLRDNRDRVTAFLEAAADLETTKGIVLHPYDERYFKELGSLSGKGIGRFVTMPQNEFDSMFSALNTLPAQPQPKSQPTEPPKSDNTKPVNLEGQPDTGIFNLNATLKFESSDIQYEPNPDEQVRQRCQGKQPSMPSKLPDSANTEAYTSFRKEIKGWLKISAEDGFSQTKVLQVLVTAFPAALKTRILNNYKNFPSDVSVAQLFAFTDSEFRLDHDKESKLAVKEFKNISRGKSEPLTVFLNHYDILFKRAQHFGFVPDTEIASDLLIAADISPVQRTDLLSKWEDEKLSKHQDSPFSWKDQLQFYFSYLRQLGRSVDLAFAAKPSAKVAAVQDQAVAAAKPVPKRRPRSRSRGRGKGDSAAVATEPAQAPPPPLPAVKTEPPSNVAPPYFPPGSIQPADAAALMMSVLSLHDSGQGKGNPWHSNFSNFGFGKGKDGKGKGKSKHGKAKTKTKNWPTANVHPNPIPPTNWGKSPGDWRCKSCQACNWAARTICYFCSQPKT